MVAAVAALTLFLAGLAIIAQQAGGTTLFGENPAALLLFWVTVLCLSLNWTLLGTVRGLGDPFRSVAMESAVYLSVFLGILWLVAPGPGVDPQQLTGVLASSIGVSIAFGVVIAAKTGARLLVPVMADIVNVIRESVSFWLASALSVANTWLPLLLLGQLAPPADVSIYVLGQRLSATLLFGLMILNARYARDYARLMSTGSIDELRSLYRRNTLAQLPSVFVMVLVLVAFAPVFFSFSGVTDERAYLITMILAGGTLVSALCGPILTALLATGQAASISAVIGITLTISIAVIIGLRANIDGPAMAWIVAATMAIQNTAMYAWWHWRMRALAA